MIKYISGIIYSALYVLLCEMFASCFFKEYPHKLRFPKVVYFVLWVVFLVAISYIFDQFIVFKYIFVILINFLFLKTIFKSKLRQTIMVALLYQIICIVSDFLILSFIQNAVPDTDISKINNSIVSFAAVFLSQTLVAFFIFWLKGTQNSEDSQLLTFKEWMQLICVPGFSIITITAVLINFDSKLSAGQSNTIFFLAVSLVVINIFVFQLILDLSARTQKSKETELQLQKSNQENELYKQKRKQYETICKREHEFQNELVALWGMLQSKKYEQLGEKIASLCNDSVEQVKHFDTNNAVVNIILNEKYNEAVARHILMITEFNDLSEVTLSESDISVVLSNMLNNAIEASAQCQNQRMIKTKITYDQGMFTISVKNHFEHELNVQGDKYLSNKTDTAQHGFGIENMRQVVDRLDGTLVIEHEDQEFSIVACFFDN